MDKAEVARVDELKGRFEHRHYHRGKYKLNFEQIKMLLDAGIPLSKIAEKAGISKQHMSNLYNSYFREIYGGVSPKHRRAGLVWAKRRRTIAGFQESRPLVKELIQEAQNNGFSVERIAVAGIGVNFKKHEIIVNKKVCLISYATSCKAFSGLRHYSWVSVARERVRKFRYWIVVQKTKYHRTRFFIFSSKHILRRIKAGKDVMLYIPVELGKESRQKIKFISFLGAWHLLK